MKCYKQIITVFLAVAIAFACCLPAVVTPAHAAAPAAAFDQVGSDASITLNNGDLLCVPSEAITGNYIVYRVNYGVYRYYVIDVFESTDGVKEMAFLSFTRYVGQLAITNANALSPDVWTIYGMQNVLYAISGALTVRPMYSTFDYYDAYGFLLIGGDGSETTEEDFSGTFEISSPDYTFTLPREIMGSNFIVVNPSGSKTLDTVRVLEFDSFVGDCITEGDLLSYNEHYISSKSALIHLSYKGNNFTVDFPNDIDFTKYPYWYVVQYGTLFRFFAVNSPANAKSGYPLYKSGATYYRSELAGADPGSFTPQYSKLSGLAERDITVLWSNCDIYNTSTSSYSFLAENSVLSYCTEEWSLTSVADQMISLEADGYNILYSTVDYYASDGSLYFSNSFSGAVGEDNLADLTLNDGTVIRVPNRFAEADSYFVVMDPVGGTEETAYLIYEFDYYEGVADGTVCDFTRWYGVATTTDDVITWEWNYQDYYVTELDILDYGPIVYSTFEYVDGRTEEEEPSGGGATSEEVKGFWDKLFAKLEEILKAIKGIGGTDLSISIENNTIIDEVDKTPFAESDYKGIVKILRRSVGFISGFFSDFIMGGVTGFFDMFDNTSSDFYGFFGLGE